MLPSVTVTIGGSVLVEGVVDEGGEGVKAVMIGVPVTARSVRTDTQSTFEQTDNETDNCGID